MKLPFEFGIKLVFRLVFPGLLIAIAMHPLVHAFLAKLDVPLQIEYLFPVEVIAWGWIVVICDMQIYMLYEGRRYWPRWLRRSMIGLEQRRLRRLAQLVKNSKEDRRRYLEASVDYAHFPIDEDGTPRVEHPTRLGNLIEAFENYPKVKYGIRSVFYWYRLWVVLDKDLREEIDNAQAVVDSTVYVSFAFYVSGMLALIYAAIRVLPLSPYEFLAQLPAFALPSAPAAAVLWKLALLSFILGYAIYRGSLHAHANFGELFKSVFDQYRDKLVVDSVVAEVSRLANAPDLNGQSCRAKYSIAWRFLRWHRIRDEVEKKNYSIQQWQARSKIPEIEGFEGG